MESPVPSPFLGRLLLTGAAGGLGRELRPRLRKRSTLLRVSDVAAMDAAQAGEEVVQAKLEDRAAVLGAQTPLGRPGTADEVAEAIVWLLSDASSYVNGALLDVSAGR